MIRPVEQWQILMICSCTWGNIHSPVWRFLNSMNPNSVPHPFLFFLRVQEGSIHWHITLLVFKNGHVVTYSSHPLKYHGTAHASWRSNASQCTALQPGQGCNITCAEPYTGGQGPEVRQVEAKMDRRLYGR